MNRFRVPPWMTALCAVVVLGLLAHVPIMGKTSAGTCPFFPQATQTHDGELANSTQSTARTTDVVTDHSARWVQEVQPDGNCSVQMAGLTRSEMDLEWFNVNPTPDVAALESNHVLKSKDQIPMTAGAPTYSRGAGQNFEVSFGHTVFTIATNSTTTDLSNAESATTRTNVTDLQDIVINTAMEHASGVAAYNEAVFTEQTMVLRIDGLPQTAEPVGNLIAQPAATCRSSPYIGVNNRLFRTNPYIT